MQSRVRSIVVVASAQVFHSFGELQPCLSHSKEPLTLRRIFRVFCDLGKFGGVLAVFFFRLAVV